MIKICKNCGKKFVYDFWKRRRYCSDDCSKKINIIYGKTTKGKIAKARAYKKWKNTEKGRKVLRKTLKRYKQTQKGKLVELKSSKKNYRKYPYKAYAQNRSRRLLKKMDIKDKRCLKCGKVSKLELHHISYKPNVAVFGLCKICHSKIHEVKK